MKYSVPERRKIGREIASGKYTVAAAAEVYGISFYTAREYLRTFKASQNVAETVHAKTAAPRMQAGEAAAGENLSLEGKEALKERIRRMSREELEEAYLESLLTEREILRLLGRRD